jgi:hypothetical protein
MRHPQAHSVSPRPMPAWPLNITLAGVPSVVPLQAGALHPRGTDAVYDRPLSGRRIGLSDGGYPGSAMGRGFF